MTTTIQLVQTVQSISLFFFGCSYFPLFSLLRGGIYMKNIHQDLKKKVICVSQVSITSVSVLDLCIITLNKHIVMFSYLILQLHTLVGTELQKIYRFDSLTLRFRIFLFCFAIQKSSSLVHYTYILKPVFQSKGCAKNLIEINEFACICLR